MIAGGVPEFIAEFRELQADAEEAPDAPYKDGYIAALMEVDALIEQWLEEE